MEIEDSPKMGTFGNLENLSFNEDENVEQGSKRDQQNSNSAFTPNSCSPSIGDTTQTDKIKSKYGINGISK